MLINSREIFTVVVFNIWIRRNIFHIYSPISWKIFPSTNTVKLTARYSRDLINVAHASSFPWSDGPLPAPPNHGNQAHCCKGLREQAGA